MSEKQNILKHKKLPLIITDKIFRTTTIGKLQSYTKQTNAKILSCTIIGLQHQLYSHHSRELGFSRGLRHLRARVCAAQRVKEHIQIPRPFPEV